MLSRAGYVDSYRRLHPDDWGFTCPAAAPAGRIDYIFADPGLAQRLEMCRVITEAGATTGSEASDHLALVAEFGLALSEGPLLPTRMRDSAATY